MPKKRSHRHHMRKHVDKKLQNRLRMYFLISFLLIGVVVFEIFTGVVSLFLAGLGIGFGILLGFITARMFHISWDHNAKQIVSRLDLFGIMILVAYMILAFFRGRIVGHFVHGPSVGGVSMALATGIMVGRTLGTRGKIVRILKEQNVFGN